MDVTLINAQSDLPLNESNVILAVKEVVKQEGQNADEVIVNFVSTETICSLHEQFFNDPSPTDCISFPMDNGEDTVYNILGEAFICPETAISYAKENDSDPHDETLLYLVHTLLHLMGYKDIEDDDVKAMRAAETRMMNHLNSLDITLRP